MKKRAISQIVNCPPWERFVANFKQRSIDECWEWHGAVGRNGYGRFAAYGRTGGAHRFSWHLYCGPIPAGLLVCHHCDNPKCVNPAHLFLGTQRDNIHDSVKKGRMKSNGHACRCLTTEQVAQVRQFGQEGLNLRQIAVQFGVSRTTINRVLLGQRYVDV